MDKEIRIKSSLHSEFSSKVVLGGEEYLVITENTGKKNTVISTCVYHNGEIINTNKTDYGGTEKLPGDEKKFEELMKRQHRLAISMLKKEKRLEAKSPSDYLEEVKSLLRKKSYKNALGLLYDAMEQHPDDPFILSYYGCLTAIVEKKHKEGIALCKSAIRILNKKVPFGQEFFYPSFYLNLGRAYLAAGRKKEAIGTLDRGLKADGDNSDILWEMRKMGRRKKPAVPFLKRSNPINKYIGMLLHKATK
jgi:tetratricopeptide (TPR) repeat protein